MLSNVWCLTVIMMHACWDIVRYQWWCWFKWSEVYCIRKM